MPYAWVTADQAWAQVAKVAVMAARSAVGGGGGGGGGGVAAARAAALGGDEELLPDLLQLLRGMTVGLVSSDARPGRHGALRVACVNVMRGAFPLLVLMHKPYGMLAMV